MSRAMKSLFLSESHGKNFDGSTRYPSRFILDIDQKFLEYVKKPEDTLIAETKNYIHYSNRYLEVISLNKLFRLVIRSFIMSLDKVGLNPSFLIEMHI